MAESPTTPHSVPAVPDSAGAPGGLCALRGLLDRVALRLDATHRACRSERAQLTERVEPRLRDMRAEAERTRAAQRSVQREVRALQAKLQSAACAAAGRARPGPRGALEREPPQAQAQAVERLHREAQRALSEVELLKAAVFHEGLVREERQRAGDAEDEAVETRLRLAEEANAELSRALVRLQAENKQIAGMVQKAADLMAKWMPRAAEREAQVERITQAFERLQAEQTQLAGVVEALELSGEQYKASHDEKLNRLERTVEGLEKQHQSEMAKKPLFASTNFLTVSNSQKENGATQSLKQRVEHFYSVYNPAKMTSVDTIIAEYAGAEEELLAALEVHYGAFGFFSYH